MKGRICHMDVLITQIIDLAKHVESVEVLWLYGSRARGLATRSSDYDLAVAFSEAYQAEDRHARVEELRYRWSQRFPEQEISLVDVTLAPVPLAYNIISDGYVLFCRNDFRLHSEEHRIWSLWSEYQSEHKANRQ